jgi:hypothetical protein
MFNAENQAILIVSQILSTTSWEYALNNYLSKTKIIISLENMNFLIANEYLHGMIYWCQNFGNITFDFGWIYPDNMWCYIFLIFIMINWMKSVKFLYVQSRKEWEWMEVKGIDWIKRLSGENISMVHNYSIIFDGLIGHVWHLSLIF